MLIINTAHDHRSMAAVEYGGHDIPLLTCPTPPQHSYVVALISYSMPLYRIAQERTHHKHGEEKFGSHMPPAPHVHTLRHGWPGVDVDAPAAHGVHSHDHAPVLPANGGKWGETGEASRIAAAEEGGWDHDGGHDGEAREGHHGAPPVEKKAPPPPPPQAAAADVAVIPQASSGSLERLVHAAPPADLTAKLYPMSTGTMEAALVPPPPMPPHVPVVNGPALAAATMAGEPSVMGITHLMKEFIHKVGQRFQQLAGATATRDQVFARMSPRHHRLTHLITLTPDLLMILGLRRIFGRGKTVDPSVRRFVPRQDNFSDP